MSLSKVNISVQEVVTFIPQNVDDVRVIESNDFLKEQITDSGNGEFQIDPQISKHIGLDEAKNKEQQRQFDLEVLKYVQKIKDAAHKEAYEAGLKEGVFEAKQQALAESQQDIHNKISALVEVMNSLGVSRSKAFEDNEKELMNFAYYMAEKIIFREIEKDPSLITEAIKRVVTGREKVTVRLAVETHQFILTHMEAISKDLDLQYVSFEADQNLAPGDVVVQSDQGILEGTLKTRLEKLKSILDDED